MTKTGDDSATDAESEDSEEGLLGSLLADIKAWDDDEETREPDTPAEDSRDVSGADSAGSTATEGESEDAKQGLLGSLLADIKAWDEESQEPDSSEGGSRDVSGTGENQAAQPASRPLTGDPIERVRAILESRELPALHVSAEHREQPTGRTVSLTGWVVIGGLLIAVVSMLLVAGVVPSPVNEGSAETAFTSDNGLGLEAADASYLNRVYRETSNEVAYCGNIETASGSPVIEVWMADTVSAGPGHIEFQTTNCPEHYDDVFLHTHPGGSIELSTKDVETLRANPGAVMCVQAGVITTTPGESTQNFACYHLQSTPTNASERVRLPVTITNEPDIERTH